MWKDKIETPKLTVDAIVEYNDNIVLIKRKSPPLGWAIPGGFVDVGESVEDAVRRELREEANLELEDLKQFHVYSKPNRDPRFHTVSVVFTATSSTEPKAGDDAGEVGLFTESQIRQMNEAGEISFDHGQILLDYYEKFKSNST